MAGGHAYEDEGAIRLRVPDEGETVVHDVIRGDIAFPHSAIKDFVIRRSDGGPLYNLAVAVDDLDMGITHVVRGDDHISNTPRQVMILRALGEEPPVYAHLPLLHGPDGKKLSKRHGAASVQDLREAGYLPEAVRNYIALLGWGYDESTTFFTTDELIQRFDLAGVSKNPAVFDDQKLRWMNGRYLRELDPEDLRRRLEELFGRSVPPEAVAISQEKMQTLADFWPLAGFLVERGPFDEKAWEKVMRDSGPERLRAAREALESAGDPFDVERVELRAARRRGAARREAEGGLSADTCGDNRDDGVARDLRVRGRARTGGDSRPHRRGAAEGLERRIAGPSCRFPLGLERGGCAARAHAFDLLRHNAAPRCAAHANLFLT